MPRPPIRGLSNRGDSSLDGSVHVPCSGLAAAGRVVASTMPWEQSFNVDETLRRPGEAVWTQGA